MYYFHCHRIASDPWTQGKNLDLCQRSDCDDGSLHNSIYLLYSIESHHGHSPNNSRSLGSGSTIPWTLGYQQPPLFHLLHCPNNAGSMAKLHSDYHIKVLQRCHNRSPRDIHKETILRGKREDNLVRVEIAKCYNHRSLWHCEMVKIST
jgi:hypothetical protein